ncbi:MAG: MaoC family dehydratase [Trueperaceae bacterium]
MSEALSARMRELLGRELGPSRRLMVDQQTIDRFADATGDRQWIHVDPERAARESPFGATVAHGMLTLSLAPGLAIELLGLEQARLVVNYGLNRVRFPAPLLVGSQVRLALTLAELEPAGNASRLTIDTRLQDDRQDRPVCVAQLVFQLHD